MGSRQIIFSMSRSSSQSFQRYQSLGVLVIQGPSISSPTTRFCFLRTIVDKWKNLVFLSPSQIDLTRDFSRDWPPYLGNQVRGLLHKIGYHSPSTWVHPLAVQAVLSVQYLSEECFLPSLLLFLRVHLGWDYENRLVDSRNPLINLVKSGRVLSKMSLWFSDPCR